MKKVIALLCAVCAFALASAFSAACDLAEQTASAPITSVSETSDKDVGSSEGDTGAHVYADEWQSDESYHWRVCVNPNHDDITDKAVHSWNGGEITSPATEESVGVITYACTVCGATKTEIIPIVTHSFGELWQTNEQNHWKVCNEDGHDDIGFLAAHDFVVETVAATESADGAVTYSCKTCGYKKVEVILKHVAADEFSFNEAEHWHACVTEGHDDRLHVAAHEWNDGKVTVEPTFEMEGEMTFSCTVCGATKTERIEKLTVQTHDYDENYSFDKTEHWRACRIEGHTDRTDIDDHTFDCGTVTTEATADHDGVMTYACEVCGYTYTETFPYDEDVVNEAFDLRFDETDAAETISGSTKLRNGVYLGANSAIVETSAVCGKERFSYAVKLGSKTLASQRYIKITLARSMKVTVYYSSVLSSKVRTLGIFKTIKAFDKYTDTETVVRKDTNAEGGVTVLTVKLNAGEYYLGVSDGIYIYGLDFADPT